MKNLLPYSLESRLSNTKTKPKIILAVSVPLVFILVIAVVAVFSILRMNHMQGLVTQTRDVLKTSTAAVSAAVDMETGMRGYLLAGEEQFLEPYNSGADRVFGLLQQLQGIVSSDPEQVARLQEAERILKNWQTDVAEPQIQLRRDIGDAPTMNDMAARVARAEGTVFFDEFRKMLSSFIAAESFLLIQRKTEFQAMMNSGNADAEAIENMVDSVTFTYDVIGTAKDILAAAIDIETGMRGYLLAGLDQFLDPLNSGRTRFETLISELSEKVSDNPAQVTRLAEMKAVIDEWDSTIVATAIDFRREIGDAATMDDMADLIAEERGRVYFDNFRGLMAEFSEAETRLMSEREAQNQRTVITTFLSVGIATMLALILGGLAAYLIGNSIGRAIETVTRAMQKLADGDNETEVVGQDRNDEVGEMARATEVFKQNAIKVQKLNEQREADAQSMAKLAQEREEATRREMETAKLAREEEHAEAQAQERAAKELATVVAACAAGDFTKRVPLDGKTGIFKELCDGVNEIASSADTSLSKVEHCLSALASGDLTAHMEGQFSGAYGRLQNSLNQMIDQLRTLIIELSERSENLAGSSGELRETSDHLSRQTEQNAASLEESAAALEELSTSLKSVDNNAKDASASAQTASDTAKASGKVAADAAASMEEISKASKEINDVVSVINDIAFQINLLALNAGVEAARAGEAGRGFSVVASEVRALAQRSSDAVTEIADVLSRSDNAVANGVAKVSDAQASLQKIVDVVVGITERVGGISSAIAEQVHGVEEINNAIASIDTNTQKQAASFEEVTATSSVLAEEAKGLKASTLCFTTSVSNEEPSQGTTLKAVQ